MFTLLAKLVRKLSKSERSSLADKLVSLAKQGQSDDSQSEEGGNKTVKTYIVDAPLVFTGGSPYFVNVQDLMQAGLKRGTFCGIIVRNTDGTKKLIVSQCDFTQEHELYKLMMYMQGYGSSSTALQPFYVSQIPESYVTEFREKENSMIYSGNE